jgi:hypothetical protein
MNDVTVRRVDESWIEVVIPTPAIAIDLSNAHRAMLAQLGHPDGAVAYDDAYQVLVGDDEIILRAKAPKTSHAVSWAPGCLNAALAILLDYRDGNVHDLRRESDTVAIAIDALRSLGADPR